MNPHRVKTKAQVETELRTRGLSPTEHTTATGRIWRHAGLNRYVQIPHAYEEMYPEFILRGLLDALSAAGIEPLQ